MKDSQTHSHQNSHRSLAETLQSILDEERTQGLSIGEIVDTVEDKGFGLLFILLSLPSAIPLPAIGYSTPFGICIAIIAIQMLIGRTKVGLPGRLRKIRLPLKFTQKMSHFSLLLLKKIEFVLFLYSMQVAPRNKRKTPKPLSLLVQISRDRNLYHI